MSAVLDYKRKVYAIRDLPTLPVIAQKLLSIADDDEAGPEKLCELISTDQSLSVKVLSLANSAYYGHRAKIGTIRHAVAIIGANMLKQIALSVLVCGTLGRGGKQRAEFWKHSFATATSAYLIAKHTGFDKDLCFMSGLLHDIGRLIIDAYFPDDRDVDHTEVGAWMAYRWQLPDDLSQAIAFHHSLDPKHLAQPVVACVHAADTGAKLAFSENDAGIAPPAEVLGALRLTHRDFEDIVKELTNRRTEIERFLI